MYEPSFAEFEKLAQQGNLIPVYREILADIETPVSILMKLQAKNHVYLLESVEGGEKWGRYSFLGTDAGVVFKVRGTDVIIEEKGNVAARPHNGNPMQFLRDLLGRYQPVSVPGLPRFYGGAVGYLGHEMVRYYEKLPCGPQDDLAIDEATFVISDSLMIFDNVRHTIKVVACALTGDADSLEEAYAASYRKIEAMIETLAAPAAHREKDATDVREVSFSSNMTEAEFEAIVQKARNYIAGGDIIQVVLSQRFQTACHSKPVDLYRALRFINPSPYLFFLKLEDITLIGSSPEVMVRLEEQTMELRPIAGTRKRGRTEQEDRQLSDELLSDEKERAEHVMLVDLGRNDLGRIAQTGSVQVTQYMVVEKYSHVMHLVSNIRAQLAKGRDAFDVLAATFPAGTLTGAPKIRAMEIIDELEPVKRGAYGGAVGYFSFSGNMDLCITIRTMLLKNGEIYIQAGAGIVHDSEPALEYQESVNKARAMLQAVRMAAGGFVIRSGKQ
ncbi:MAG: anthranilate synthase component I [Deltaproteobacteria bacterium HGW-Deltaproteobacteria-12]|jgi:anthranilate synthase component 1|nr:MAG: anthranilate synthase component I [Deltaproteobacteria bacterium HGW-Deltaproteobacteria-12]